MKGFKTRLRDGLLIIAISGWTFVGAAIAQETIRVGLMDLNATNSFRCQSAQGSYEWVLPDGQKLGPLTGMPTVTSHNGGFQISSVEFPEPLPYVILQPVSIDARLRIVTSAVGYRQYPGALHFVHVDDIPQFIMESTLEDYLPGVLAAEVGKGHAMSFYAAHAMISRTYATKSMGRHRMAGFDLCDQVHCQVFDGTSTVNDTLQRGCQSTRSLILVDRLGRAATTAFHSNCGGKTWAGSDVWSDQLPYLQSVDDAACADAPHARWSQTVPRQEWDEFWSLHEADSMQGLLTARKRYGWPSASFQINPDSLRPDVYKVVGSGFGHGVGLCQEGAMQRALSGATAWEILQHYYNGVRLSKSDQL